MEKGKQEVFSAVLHIGEDHVHFRGGIGAVLATYKKFFPAFRAIGTQRRISNIGKVFYFAQNYIRMWWTLLTRPEIKLLHIHGSFGQSVYRKAVVAFTAKSIFRKKFIYHIHSSEYILKYDAGSGLYKKFCHYLLDHADVVGCLTPKWEEQYRQKFGLTNTRVMYNLIAPPAAIDFPRAHKDPAEPLKLLFLGLIDEKKGVFDMVEMARRHRAALEGKLTIFLGGVGKTDRLKEEISRDSLENILDYRGWINETGKNQYFRNVDGFILPSYNEGLPICILEAMSYGLPVMASRVGGIPEIMEDRVNGFLFERGDQEAMFAAINQYVENNYLLEQHSKESLRLIRHFYPEEVVPQMEALYRSLL
ncbi:glycosyltransferase family 4 protein [Flavihumibacter petaseus]|uniref:Putative glycosyltransferase n=1 Tax=Flavihumibacter petaseus NBRC 106054 TaxID=1220578 RepID=A0A0E9N077_9BACT|nr:glycosyltransferase family 4 protein [Flavihumibacter petaseus]GAO43254.1 putative glycosyltransferase [Flavihumibacter petaseus NBRC 106054]